MAGPGAGAEIKDKGGAGTEIKDKGGAGTGVGAEHK